MSKVLVAYFSASGVTAKLANELAKATCADVFEIKPETAYTAADLDWRDKQSRSTLEMADLSCRPAISGKVADMAQYDTVFVGFPIWWGREPSVVDSFLEAYDFSNKKIVPFCTSGSSNIGKTAERIAELTSASVDAGKRIDTAISAEELQLWADTVID